MASADPSPAPAQGAGGSGTGGGAGRPAISHRSTSGRLGALWIIAPLMPGLAAASTVGIYLFLPTKAGTTPAAPNDPLIAVAAGLLITLAVWVIGGYGGQGLVTAPRAQLRLYAELLERSRSLRDRARSITATSLEGQSALTEATTQLDNVYEELEGEGKGAALRWALASGYMSVMRGLHRADEALIMAEPVEAVLGDALHDALSLEGAAIGNVKRLAGIVSGAMDHLSPAAAAAFLPPDANRNTQADKALSDHEAREALREVRHAINEYRDDRHDGLVRARNRLVWTMLAVGVTSYLLLGLALLADIGIPYVQAVSVFYLVGALVGLFNRLRIEAGQTSAVEDFGLSQARLVVTPLVSGLAAVGGVYLIAMAPALLPSSTAGGAAPPQLTAVFDLASNPVGIVYAAIFGLAPGALTSRLTAASTRLEKDLQSTEAATATTATSDQGAQ